MISQIYQTTQLSENLSENLVKQPPTHRHPPHYYTNLMNMDYEHGLVCRLLRLCSSSIHGLSNFGSSSMLSPTTQPTSKPTHPRQIVY